MPRSMHYSESHCGEDIEGNKVDAGNGGGCNLQYARASIRNKNCAEQKRCWKTVLLFHWSIDMGYGFNRGLKHLVPAMFGRAQS